MAEQSDTEDFNIQAITQHLKKRPFAPIFEHSNEKDDHIALKLMCIVDYKTQRHDFYSRMQNTSPKLLTQLLQFHSYGTFKHYDYQVGQEIGKRVLKCKFCELIGPYGLILTHMAITHNVHVGLQRCAYCSRTDLKDHFKHNTTEQCYANYLQRNDIEWCENVCSIVSDFYGMLRGLAFNFNINTYRNYGFTGKGHKVTERLNRSGGGYDSDMDENVTVYSVRTPNIKSKNISGRLEDLNQEFKRVIGILYGGNNVYRLLQQAANENSSGKDDTVTIISDDDYDDGGGGVYDENNGHSRAGKRPFQLVTNTTSSESGGGDTAAAFDAHVRTPRYKIRFRDILLNGTNESTLSTSAPKREPLFDDNFQRASTSSMPMAQTVRDETKPTTTTTNATMAPAATTTNAHVLSMDDRKNDVELFGQYVMQRLYRLTDDFERRKMECAIQQAIAKTEIELLECKRNEKA